MKKLSESTQRGAVERRLPAALVHFQHDLVPSPTTLNGLVPRRDGYTVFLSRRRRRATEEEFLSAQKYACGGLRSGRLSSPELIEALKCI